MLCELGLAFDEGSLRVCLSYRENEGSAGSKTVLDTPGVSWGVRHVRTGQKKTRCESGFQLMR